MAKTENWDEILAGVGRKDQQSMARLVESSQQKLFEFCLYLTGNSQLSEDICQDTYIKAFRNIGQLKDPRRIMPWLKQIARRLYIDHCRSSRNSKLHVSMDESSEVFHLEGPGVSSDLIDAVKLLHRLTEEDRSLLILIEVQGYSYQEAAQALEINEGTLKSRLHRARAQFSSLFKETKSALASS